MTKYNPVLLVMKPRKIPGVLESIKNSISIPTYLFEAYTESKVCLAINNFISRTNYTHYIISADDIIYTKSATQEILKKSQLFYENNQNVIITGWCSLCDTCPTSNLVFEPLTLQNGSYPEFIDYKFISLADINTKYDSNAIFSTYLISFAFSSIPRNILLKYPMQTYQHGYSSDHNFSFRYYNAEGKTAYTNRNMFFRHLKQKEDKSYRDPQYWLVNKKASQIIELIPPSKG